MPADRRTGPADQQAAEEIIILVSQLPMVAELPSWNRNGRLQGVWRILAWLQEHPGSGWQERWLAAGADQDTQWLDVLVADDPRVPAAKRSEMVYAVSYLMGARVVLPDYGFLAAYNSTRLFPWVRQARRPDLFARVEQAGAELGLQPPQLRDAVKAITRMILHTGRDLGPGYYDQQRATARQVSHHVGKLASLGYEVTLSRPDPGDALEAS